jgi:uncharacterized Fe-S cluster-containing radical SAM superfamily enzyme
MSKALEHLGNPRLGEWNQKIGEMADQILSQKRKEEEELLATLPKPSTLVQSFQVNIVGSRIYTMPPQTLAQFYPFLSQTSPFTEIASQTRTVIDVATDLPIRQLEFFGSAPFTAGETIHAKVFAGSPRRLEYLTKSNHRRISNTNKKKSAYSQSLTIFTPPCEREKSISSLLRKWNKAFRNPRRKLTSKRMKHTKPLKAQL